MDNLIRRRDFKAIADPLGWSSGQPYTFQWKSQTSLNMTNGAEVTGSGNEQFSTSYFMPCRYVSVIHLANVYNSNGKCIAYYNKSKTFISAYQIGNAYWQLPAVVPKSAYFFRVYTKTPSTVSAIPYLLETATDTLNWVDSRYYMGDSGLIYCYGAGNMNCSRNSRTYYYFYNKNKTQISYEIRQNSTGNITIPDGAYYVKVDNGSLRCWVQFFSKYKVFEEATNALYLDRYNNANNPLYCNIYNNHVDFNVNKQSSSIYYWTGTLSSYNTGNKEWLLITGSSEGTTVQMIVRYLPNTLYNNMYMYLRKADDDSQICSCRFNNATLVDGKRVQTSSTVTLYDDTYAYIGFSTTPASKQWQMDIEIYINGVREV